MTARLRFSWAATVAISAAWGVLTDEWVTFLGCLGITAVLAALIAGCAVAARIAGTRSPVRKVRGTWERILIIRTQSPAPPDREATTQEAKAAP